MSRETKQVREEVRVQPGRCGGVGPRLGTAIAFASPPGGSPTLISRSQIFSPGF